MSNTVKINPNGPFSVKGNLSITVGDETEEKTSAYLCRCGASTNKPYCDGAHKSCGFEDVGSLGEHKLSEGAASDEGELSITTKKNGPLVVIGPVTLSAGEDSANRSISIGPVPLGCIRMHLGATVFVWSQRR